MSKHVLVLSVLGVLCSLSLGAPTSTCGREGQTPCKGGCEIGYLPKVNPVAEWYPDGDIFVVAPAGYRQTQGLCTRCGNLYEPVCTVAGKPRCFIDPRAGIIMEPTEDGYCVPPKQKFGCGTTGLPPCPESLAAAKYGTVAVLSKDDYDDGWQLTASLGEIDGCMYSTHNLVLRFVKAPETWLPEGHKCANVCVQCGIPGHPACNIEPPHCMRRTAEDQSERYRDGPTYTDTAGTCRALHCGAATIDEELPACTEPWALAILSWVNTKEDAAPGYGVPLDFDGDGCVEPFKNVKGYCKGGQPESTREPAIREREYDCTREATTLIDQEMIDRVKAIIGKEVAGSPEQKDLVERLNPILSNKGKCVECGRSGDLPCQGMDFDGCMTAEGYMLDQDVGLCVEAPCGGGHGQFRSPPWNSSDCIVERPAWYDTPSERMKSPINEFSSCLYFHDLVTDPDGKQHCESCGTPGKWCQQECVIGIEFHPMGIGLDGLGEFQFLDDSIRTSGPLKGHCPPFPVVEVYDDTCAQHDKRVSDTNDLSKLPPAPVYSPQVSPTSDEAGFGTASNPDECRHAVESVERVYEEVCPGPDGGTPVSKWGQCGGLDYSGPSCCFGYSVCVKKSEFYSICEGANVPSELIPWHAPCGGEDAGTCEPGSACEAAGDTKFCNPARQHIPRTSFSIKKAVTDRAAIGIAIGVLAALALLTAGAFVYGRRQGISKGHFKLSGWGDAESYANASNTGASKRLHPATLDGSSTTYLDLAAATEAEALQQKRTQGDAQDVDATDRLDLPTSNSGIGRRA